MKSGKSKRKITFKRSESNQMQIDFKRVTMQAQAALHNVLLVDRMLNELFPAIVGEWKDAYIKKQKEEAGLPPEDMQVTTDETPQTFVNPNVSFQDVDEDKFIDPNLGIVTLTDAEGNSKTIDLSMDQQV